MSNLQSVARRAIKLIDLTSLNDDDTEGSVAVLCRNAKMVFGNTAAVCIYPRFIPAARKTLIEQGTPDIRVATVANFPHGNDDVEAAFAETQAALAGGADEVDVVFPYRAFLSGNKQAGFELVSRCKAACGGIPLKVIIETGELREESFIINATRICIEAGADFIKTSTGKVPVNATPGYARTILQVIRDLGVEKSVGFKAAGGIRTTQDAAAYLAIADEIFGPDWADQSHFRFGRQRSPELSRFCSFKLSRLSTACGGSFPFSK